MGFPPIGIMSLSSVLKQAGHECVIFDQANPDTPNQVIIDEIKRQQPALVGLSFLSTTSYPYAKILARQIRAANSTVKLAFGGVFATLNAALVKLQCSRSRFRLSSGDGEQFFLDLLDRIDDPADVAAHLGEGRPGRAELRPADGAPSRPMAFPGPRKPSARLCRIDAARRAGGALDGTIHDGAIVSRLSLALCVLRHSNLQRRQMAGAQC